MNRKNATVAAAILATVLAAAYPASSWYFGRQIEAAHAESVRMITAQPYLKLVRHDYERNLFDASEVITLEIPSALFRLPSRPDTPKAEATTTPESEPETGNAEAPQAGAPAAPATTGQPAPLPPLRITLKTAIQHGPLPGLNSLAAGSSSTTVEFEGDLQKKVLEAFAGKTPLEIRTRYDFLGGGLTKFSSPAFRIAIPDPEGTRQTTLSGNGLEMEVEFTRGLQQMVMHASAPRFEMNESNGTHMLLSELRAESRQQRIFEDDPALYSGSQQFSLEELSIDPGQETGHPIALKEIKYDVQMPVTGEFIDLIAQLGAKELRVGEQNYGPAHYDLSLKHLNARKLMALNRSLMALYTQPEMLQDTNRLLQAFTPMKDQLVALLLDSPSLSLDRISFSTPEGEAKITAVLKLLDPKAEDFANPVALTGKIDFAADITFPRALIAAALQSGQPASTEGPEGKTVEETPPQPGPMAGQALDRLVEQGHVIVDGALLKSRVSFRNGQLLVNEKPFNPLAMAQPQAPAELPK